MLQRPGSSFVLWKVLLIRQGKEILNNETQTQHKQDRLKYERLWGQLLSSFCIIQEEEKSESNILVSLSSLGQFENLKWQFPFLLSLCRIFKIIQSILNCRGESIRLHLENWLEILNMSDPLSSHFREMSDPLSSSSTLDMYNLPEDVFNRESGLLTQGEQDEVPNCLLFDQLIIPRSCNRGTKSWKTANFRHSFDQLAIWWCCRKWSISGAPTGARILARGVQVKMFLEGG